MNNSNKGEFYFGITDTQIYICFFEEGKNAFEQTLDFEIPDYLSNKLNFKIVQNLLKENIRKLEKDLGFFLNSGNISIKSKSYQSITFSIKNIFDENKLNEKIIINLIQGAIQQFYKIEKNLYIAHILINKYIIDEKVYDFFPKNIDFKKIILEIEFICLDNNLINKVKSLFQECKIDVKNIISFDYAKKFLNQEKDYTLCVSAKKILNGANQSEIYFMDISSKKPSLFHKIFNFFD